MMQKNSIPFPFDPMMQQQSQSVGNETELALNASLLGHTRCYERHPKDRESYPSSGMYAHNLINSVKKKNCVASIVTNKMCIG